MVNYYFYFIVYSFLGWVMETVECSIREKRFVNRGFLNGPICPIYGVGMGLIIFFLNPFINNIFLLFIFGMILATILEYAVGYILEKLFYTRWWDYSQHKFNLNGYICLQVSICWGFLCVIMMEVVQPQIVKLEGMINQQFFNTFLSVSLIVLIIDIIVTLINLTNFRINIASLNKLQAKIKDEANIGDKLEYLHTSLQDNKINLKQYLTSFKEHLSVEGTKYEKYIKRLEKERVYFKGQLNRLMRNYKTKSKLAHVFKDNTKKDKH